MTLDVVIVICQFVASGSCFSVGGGGSMAAALWRTFVVSLQHLCGILVASSQHLCSILVAFLIILVASF
jgi:hypothetical protein